jgi:hypothetical protein
MSRPRAAGTVQLAEVGRLREQVRQRDDTIDLLNESFADLERSLSDPGWIRLSAQFEQEFTPEGLKQIRAICRLMAVKNPLVRRGLSLRQAYVWGKGCEITARANGKQDNEQDVQAVVDQFLNDPGNQRAFTSSAARERLERCLGTDGEFFPALFTLPTTGEVQVRVVGADEITDIIHNPEDKSDPWYYRREWIQRAIADDGRVVDQRREQFHPALSYKPKSRPKTFGRIPVAWDAPILHIKVNDLEGWDRGLPDAYAAIDWAMAYKVFLEDWARLVKSLSRFAWRMTAKGSTRTQAKAKLAERPAVDAAGRASVGDVAMTPPDQIFEAIPKSGATIDSESGKPIAAMVAAALDVPLTMLLADPGQTGARAVAETLDKPTELAMGQRRDLWGGAYRTVLTYAVAQAVQAPDGLLKGSVVADRYGRETVKLAGDTDPVVDIDWPDLDAKAADTVTAVVEASSTGVLPPEHVARLLLTALGVRHVDTLLEEMTDDDGNFVWPEGPGSARANDPNDLAGGGSMQVEPGGAPGEGDDSPELNGALERQADADFGLFGGDGTDDTPLVPAGAGPKPKAGYDPEFFRI